MIRTGTDNGSSRARRIRAISRHGRLAGGEDDFQSALDSYERALSLLGADPDWRRERAEARLRIVECHRKRGEFQEALAELARIRQGNRSAIDADLDAKITGRTGMVQTSLGHYLVAQANCAEAYEALRSGNDNAEIGLLELALGQIARVSGRTTGRASTSRARSSPSGGSTIARGSRAP